MKLVPANKPKYEDYNEIGLDNPLYPIKKVCVKAPVPDSVKWHEATNWKYAEKLYDYSPSLWEKIKSQAPFEVYKRVEEYKNKIKGEN